MARVEEVETAYLSLQSRYDHDCQWRQKRSTPFYEWGNGTLLLDEHKTSEVLSRYAGSKGDRLDVLYDIQATLRELGEARLTPAFAPTRSMSGVEVRLFVAS